MGRRAGPGAGVQTFRMHTVTLRRSAVALALAAVAAAAAACSSDEPAPADGADPTSAPAGGQQFRGSLAEPGSGQPAQGEVPAYTYDPAAAPAGAQLAAEVESGGGVTSIRLDVEGLQPDRGYAVHAHVNPCGDDGMAAGPHFQNEVDPAATPDTPSSDPAYANPENEFWLDLGTDAEGNGDATAEVPFGLTDRRPQSIIVHEEMMTATAPGEAGTAGGRLACLDLPLD